MLKDKYSVLLLCVVTTLFLPTPSYSLENDTENILPTSEKLATKTLNRSWSFEELDPFFKWASDGKYTVHYKGITSAKSSKGKKSFKLSITFDTASYVYYMIPLSIPNYGELFFKGDIYVSGADTAKAALGTNVSLYPFKFSGVNILNRQTGEGKEWITQLSDLVEAGELSAERAVYKYFAFANREDVLSWTDKVGLFLFGQPGDSITVFVDNISINGSVPETTSYSNYAYKKLANYSERYGKILNKLLEDIGGYKNTEVDSLTKKITSKGYLPKDKLGDLSLIAEEKNFLMHNQSSEDLVLFSWEPTSEKRITTFTNPIPSFQTDSLNITTTLGEYEPASFIIRAQKDQQNVNITLTDMHGEDGVIPAHAFNVKWVKCWYQAGRNDLRSEKSNKYLTPELLLKDDGLIKVDHTKKVNFLKVNIDGKEKYIDISSKESVVPEGASIRDAMELLPIDLKRDTNKQVWITSKIPVDTKPGSYHGKLLIKCDNKVSKVINIHVEVLPFSLPPSPIEYSIYYCGKLFDLDNKIISSSLKNSQQYRIEMKDLKDHGIDSATFYQGFSGNYEEALEIRNENGLNNGKLYIVNLGLFKVVPDGQKKLGELRKYVERWLEVAKKFNYSKTFIYGLDEANIEMIKAQRQPWQIVHEAGAHIFVACSKYAYEIADGLLNIGILNGELDAVVAGEWKKRGLKVFSYANPQVGLENPGIYRKNYGFALWHAGYDGAMDFAYQYQMGDIWNDFDHPIYRDHVFAYPATNSIIDTIQWEGFREAIDDTRYLRLLEITNELSDESLMRWYKDTGQKDSKPYQVRNNIINTLKKIKTPKNFKYIQ